MASCVRELQYNPQVAVRHSVQSYIPHLSIVQLAVVKKK